MTTVELLEQTIQDFIDECADHEQCGDCPCAEFCSRFDYGADLIPPAAWSIQEKYKGVPC